MNDDEFKSRFLAKVLKTEKFWLWTGQIDKQGYGRVKRNGRPRGAHIVSYELFKGEIPPGKLVRHKCDIRQCVRPDCLFLGTHVDNAKDRSLRNRNNNQTGNRHYSHLHPEWVVRGGHPPGYHGDKLDLQKAVAIRQEFASGNFTKTDLAKKHDVSIKTISNVLKGRIWRERVSGILSIEQP